MRDFSSLPFFLREDIHLFLSGFLDGQKGDVEFQEDVSTFLSEKRSEEGSRKGRRKKMIAENGDSGGGGRGGEGGERIIFLKAVDSFF